MKSDLQQAIHSIIDQFEVAQIERNDFARTLSCNLSHVIKCGIELKCDYVDSETKDISINIQPIKHKIEQIFGGDDLYRQVYDPTEDHEWVTFSLVNDLIEIYEVLKRTSISFNESPKSAEWIFYEEFRGHLYQHLMNAQKVLYIKFCKDF